MMKMRGRKSERALTRVEVLIVIVVLVILAMMFLPTLARTPRPYRTICVNNLKQIGLCFRQWAIDHGGEYPMSVSLTNDGTKEFVSRGGVYLHYLVLKNELNTPKPLHCPADKARTNATSFMGGFGEINISYFVGVDATQTQPGMFLSGDRNLTNGPPSPRGILTLKSNSVVGWTQKIHERQGNIGLADGSVQSSSTIRVREFLATTGVATNRLAMPWY